MQKDKRRHFLAGLIITVAVSVLSGLLGCPHSITAGAVAGMSSGLLWEIGQAITKRGNADPVDAIATAVGSALGVGLYAVLLFTL